MNALTRESGFAVFAIVAIAAATALVLGLTCW
jgi:hypothetical protein